MAARLTMRAVPILPVRDVERALAFYATLGFDVRAYDGESDGGGYGFATRDGAELHLGYSPEPHRTSAYLHVADADVLAAEWRAAGAEVHGPEDTPWGRHEGALVDPDDNVLRFGSPM